jgi:hypothetical protein
MTEMYNRARLLKSDETKAMKRAVVDDVAD